MKRERIRQIVLAVIGLFYFGLLYPLYTDLWNSKWLIEMHNEECEPMFITFFRGARILSAIGGKEAERVSDGDCVCRLAESGAFGRNDY